MSDQKTTMLVTTASVGTIVASLLQAFTNTPIMTFMIMFWLQLNIRGPQRADLVSSVVECILNCAPELIFALVALALGKVSVVRVAAIGTIQANALLVLGVCFIVAAWEQGIRQFPQDLYLTNARMLLVALGSLAIVATFVSYGQVKEESLPALSHAAAVTLLALYCCYWWFSYGTHLVNYPSKTHDSKDVATRKGVAMVQGPEYETHQTLRLNLAERRQVVAVQAASKLAPSMIPILGLGAIALTTRLSVITLSHFDGIASPFVELVILPLATTTIENVIAVLHTHGNEIDWMIQSTVVSSISIALFVMPVALCVAWATGQDGMTLQFSGYQAGSVFLTALVVNNVLRGPNGHWIEGSMLIAFYILLSTMAWFDES